MSRVVLDTNVYISALMFGGLPGSLLDLAFLRVAQIVEPEEALSVIVEDRHRTAFPEITGSDPE